VKEMERRQARGVRTGDLVSGRNVPRRAAVLCRAYVRLAFL